MGWFNAVAGLMIAIVCLATVALDAVRGVVLRLGIGVVGIASIGSTTLLIDPSAGDSVVTLEHTLGLARVGLLLCIAGYLLRHTSGGERVRAWLRSAFARVTGRFPRH